MGIEHAQVAAEMLNIQGLCTAMGLDPEQMVSDDEAMKAEERKEDLTGMGLIHTYYNITDYRGWYRDRWSGELKGNIPITITGNKHTSYNTNVRWEEYHHI